jgi:hypothetical protein
MNTTKNLPGLLTAMLLAQAGSAQAGFVTYTDKAAFLSAVSGAQTDSFNDLVIGNVTPIIPSRTVGIYQYTVATENGFFPLGSGGSTALSAIFPESISFAIISGSPTAMGGFFFCTDSNTSLTSGTISVSINNGLFLMSVSTNSAENFFGWISDDGAPITSFQVTPTGNDAFSTVNDLIFAQAAPIPEPSTYGLILGGLALAGAAIRRRRAKQA